MIRIYYLSIVGILAIFGRGRLAADDPLPPKMPKEVLDCFVGTWRSTWRFLDVDWSARTTPAPWQQMQGDSKTTVKRNGKSNGVVAEATALSLMSGGANGGQVSLYALAPPPPFSLVGDFSYDLQTREFRSRELTGQWDEKLRTLTLKFTETLAAEPPYPSEKRTYTITHTFLDANSLASTYILRSDSGKTYYKIEQRSSRVK